MQTDVQERFGEPPSADRREAARGVGDRLGERADELIGDLRVLRRPRIFVISGPSGVGKDTVIETLRDAYPEAYFAVTATTRSRRPGEIDGVHYYFMDDAAFDARLAEDEFLESAVVYDHKYGVPRGPIRAALSRRQDVFIKVDVQGAQAIRTLVPQAISIFVSPESMTALLQRLRARKTDEPEALMRRFGTASRELSSASDFDYVVFNESDQVEQAVAQICAIVTAEHFRTVQEDIRI
ncbi:MAG: guanylate kinase [Thermomicrobiales bacterium]|nr:guanylate kinase [Thermomicrobiales bacterium]